MKSLKDIDASNRPREKALREGIENLTNEELLAIVIGNGGKNNTVLDISKSLLDTYGSFADLLKCDLYSLMKVKGIKTAKALNVMAIMEISKRANIEKISYDKRVNSAQDIYEIVKYELEDEKQECFLVIYFNIKMQIIKKEMLFKGGMTNSFVDINLILKNAITCGAKNIICIHNHPSGDPTPSKEDLCITEKILECCKIVKINLLDHIIIGKNDFFSFKRMNVL